MPNLPAASTRLESLIQGRPGRGNNTIACSTGKSSPVAPSARGEQIGGSWLGRSLDILKRAVTRLCRASSDTDACGASYGNFVNIPDVVVDDGIQSGLLWLTVDRHPSDTVFSASARMGWSFGTTDPAEMVRHLKGRGVQDPTPLFAAAEQWGGVGISGSLIPRSKRQMTATPEIPPGRAAERRQA